MNWQPIETAPKDGAILVWMDGYIIEVRWTNESVKPGWVSAETGYKVGSAPTHWMPLPAPPASMVTT